ncbi:MAG TPA: hypothetical protein VJ876_04485 [Bacteroidales bacterium]|nr:hypothetical protein [Bacteroidales bacterium]
MEHIVSILWLAAWPVLIFAVYKLAWFAVKRKGYHHDEQGEEQ